MRYASCGHGGNPPVFCGAHKTVGMVNLIGRRCAVDACEVGNLFVLLPGILVGVHGFSRLRRYVCHRKPLGDARCFYVVVRASVPRITSHQYVCAGYFPTGGVFSSTPFFAFMKDTPFFFLRKYCCMTVVCVFRVEPLLLAYTVLFLLFDSMVLLTTNVGTDKNMKKKTYHHGRERSATFTRYTSYAPGTGIYHMRCLLLC